MVLDILGAKVYCEVTGDGPYALLLHGWGGRCGSWAPVARDLARTHKVINLDFPGHGKSSNPPVPWSVSEYADMTSLLLRELGCDKVDVIAHSFGGRVALRLAATHPETVKRMVLSGVPALKKPPTLKSRARSASYKALKSAATGPMARKLAGDERVDKLLDALQRKFGSEDYRALSPDMRKTFSRVVSQDLSVYLPKIASETLLFWGEDDDAAPVWIAREMERVIPDAGLVVVPGAGHFAYLDRYPQFWAVVNSFLN